MLKFALGNKMIVVYPVGRPSDAQLYKAGHFLCQHELFHNIRLPSRKIKLAIRVEPSSFNQREVQPFLCLCASAERWKETR